MLMDDMPGKGAAYAVLIMALRVHVQDWLDNSTADWITHWRILSDDTCVRRGAGPLYHAITMVHTMPLSSSTIARAAAQTAHPRTPGRNRIRTSLSGFNRMGL